MTSEEVRKHIQLSFRFFGFQEGRMISASKSEYKKDHPDNLVIFNSTIVLKSGGQSKMVDLDLTLDNNKLSEMARQIGEFIILRESDSWGADPKNYEQLKEKAVKIYA